MRQFVEDWVALQQQLRLKPSTPWMTDRETLDAALRHRDRMVREVEAWMWWTFWQVVLTSEAVSIGLIDFKGPPGFDRGVAVGYAFARAYWGHGYATEAVGALLAWAWRQSEVLYVSADTDIVNVRSCRVLRELGFEPRERVAGGMTRHGDAGDLPAWRIVKPGI